MQIFRKSPPQSCDIARERAFLKSFIDSFSKRYCVHRMLKYKCLNTRTFLLKYCVEKLVKHNKDRNFHRKIFASIYLWLLKSEWKVFFLFLPSLPELIELKVCFFANVNEDTVRYFFWKNSNKKLFCWCSFFISLRWIYILTRCSSRYLSVFVAWWIVMRASMRSLRLSHPFVEKNFQLSIVFGAHSKGERR